MHLECFVLWNLSCKFALQFENMLSIPVKEGDNIERALKRFKKKFDRTKRMRELRTRREFVKPSVLNRDQRKKAIYKNGLNLKND